jgi:hypothetical protein
MEDTTVRPLRKAGENLATVDMVAADDIDENDDKTRPSRMKMMRKVSNLR